MEKVIQILKGYEDKVEGTLVVLTNQGRIFSQNPKTFRWTEVSGPLDIERDFDEEKIRQSKRKSLTPQGASVRARGRDSASPDFP